MKRILLVDDHEVVRDGVKRILDRPDHTMTYGEASNGPEALRLVRELDWHLAVLDISLGEGSGLEVLKELKHIRPNMPVLILTMHSEEQYARRAFKAGAAGYVTKDSSRSELAEAVEKVMKGGTYVSRSLAEKLVVYFANNTERPLHELLSDREFEVMRWIASGKTVTEIAALLTLSDKTISTYRARILEKMEMKNNAELMHYALRNNLV
jgi:two-component system invasion response regulator UvrY